MWEKLIIGSFTWKKEDAISFKTLGPVFKGLSEIFSGFIPNQWRNQSARNGNLKEDEQDSWMRSHFSPFLARSSLTLTVLRANKPAGERTEPREAAKWKSSLGLTSSLSGAPLSLIGFQHWSLRLAFPQIRQKFLITFSICTMSKLIVVRVEIPLYMILEWVQRRGYKFSIHLVRFYMLFFHQKSHKQWPISLSKFLVLIKKVLPLPCRWHPFINKTRRRND